RGSHRKRTSRRSSWTSAGPPSRSWTRSPLIVRWPARSARSTASIEAGRPVAARIPVRAPQRTIDGRAMTTAPPPMATRIATSKSQIRARRIAVSDYIGHGERRRPWTDRKPSRRWGMPATDLIVDLFIRYGFQVLGALVILVVGAIVARWTGRVLDRRLQMQAMEPPMRVLLVRFVKILVLLFAFVVALDKFGFQVAPLVAGIGVAGLGVGLAMQ